MPEDTQFQIVQEIARRALSVAEGGWTELMVVYYVEGSQSAILKTYLVDEGGVTKEQALPYADGLDSWLRKLQTHLSQSGKQPFTKCKIHLWAGGKFETTYGYEKVDWEDLITPDWNFFPKKVATNKA